jgi:hypothetical protein
VSSESKSESQSSTHPRSDVYRYVVDAQKSDLTPLAQVEAFLGQEKLRVLNISQGGVALLVQDGSKFSKNDHLDLSLSIREKHFPVQVAVKNIQSCRLSCAFVEPQPGLQQTLKEFLKSKYLGTTLKKNTELSKDSAYLSLVKGASQLEVFAGENQTGVFVWMGHDREIKKFLAVSQEMVVEWSVGEEIRTGRINYDAPASFTGSELLDQFQWDRVPADSMKHHFADILLAWMDVSVGPDFVKGLFEDSQNADHLKFPKLG